MWFDILKSVELMAESSVLSRMEGAKSAVEKGYPAFITPLRLVVKKEGEKLVAYTSFSDLGDFFFVGNSYTAPEEQGKGYFSQVINSRREYTRGKPRVTLLNPKNERAISTTRTIVRREGGKEIQSYDDVSDFMSEEDYKAMFSTGLKGFRYPVL